MEIYEYVVMYMSNMDLRDKNMEKYKSDSKVSKPHKKIILKIDYS